MADLTPETPQASAPAVSSPADTTPVSGPTPEEKQFPETYVKTLRNEAAETRNKLRDAEAKLKTLELEKLTETERTQRERDEYKAKAEALEAQIAEQTLRVLRAEIATKHKLPVGSIDRLRGITRDEIEADALLLLREAQELAPPRAPQAEGGERPVQNRADARARAIEEAKRTGRYAA